MSNTTRPAATASIEEELEAMRRAPYPNPADQDRGETLAWTGIGIGLMGVGVVAASAICPPCMLGAVPLCVAAAPGLVAAGAFKRWRSKKNAAAATIP